MGIDEPAYGYDGLPLSPDPDGVDSEGLAVARDRTFWIADEYRPSLALVDTDGVVLARLVPRGDTLRADAPTEPVLPSIYARRRLNRGFESVALSADGTRLVAMIESPLEFPDRKTGRASRMLRVLVLDPRRRVPVAEHVYVLEAASKHRGTRQDEMRVSDASFIDGTTLLVVERSPGAPHIFQIDLRGATNLLGSRWSDPEKPTEALETLSPERLRALGIQPVRKTLVIDLGHDSRIPKKIEGLAILNPNTIAVGNDNDFGFTGFGPTGRAILTDAPSVLTVVRLPSALPVAR
jgi:hypothetical protein